VNLNKYFEFFSLDAIDVEEYSSMPLAFPHGLAMWHS
jgi:hypothetical protein